MHSGCDNCCSQQLGFPIRTSPDHRLLASPRSLSQLATSFIAYLRQGIHTHALSSLTIKFTLDTNFKLTTSAPRRILPSRRVLQLVLPINIQLSKNRTSFSEAKTQHPLKDPDSWILTICLSCWWAWVESNYRPHPYQGCALAN